MLTLISNVHISATKIISARFGHGYQQGFPSNLQWVIVTSRRKMMEEEKLLEQFQGPRIVVRADNTI